MISISIIYWSNIYTVQRFTNLLLDWIWSDVTFLLVNKQFWFKMDSNLYAALIMFHIISWPFKKTCPVLLFPNQFTPISHRTCSNMCPHRFNGFRYFACCDVWNAIKHLNNVPPMPPPKAPVCQRYLKCLNTENTMNCTKIKKI